MIFLKFKLIEIFVIIFLFLFYLFGLIFLYNNKEFFKYSYLVIFFNFLVLVLFQKNRFNIKTFILFILLFFIFLFIEILGVKTGKIFGSYYYGDSLGLKFFNVPIIIGLNWIFLIYLTYCIADIFKINNYQKIFLGSLLMLFYDISLERVASYMNLWYWQESYVPLLNYLSWFIISLTTHSLLRFLNLKIENNLSLFIYLLQIIFLFIISLLY